MRVLWSLMLSLVVASSLVVSTAALAQEPQSAPPPPGESQPTPPEPAPEPTASAQPGPTASPAEPADAVPPQAAPSADQARNRALIDGHVREGAFLSGPGSLTFILHHTLMGAAAGVVTQGIGSNFSLDLGAREAMLAGTLIGAGIGFGTSAWWQFNHWIGRPMASYGIVDSVLSGMLLFGLVDLFTNDKIALAWTSVIGFELGAWLTATLGGGDMPVNHGLLIASGGLWGLVYSTLALAIINTGGSLKAETWVDTLFITAGLGAGAMALATSKYNPSSAQILRADFFGLGVGGAVFLLSEVVLGLNFNQATPYVLAAISSAGAIAAVSLLWEEAAERPEERSIGQGGWYFYRSKDFDKPYACVWW